MAFHFSEIWLLIGVAFVIQLPVTRCQLCPRNSTFHNLTRSCIGLIKKHQTYFNAKYYCQGNFRGGTTKTDGHLVFIFDQATDQFVKGLLDGHDVDRALIGLNDRAANGHYTWGDYNRIKATYTAWADNPHTPDVYKNVVVMTKDGWLEYYGSYQVYFVCQASVDFPTPKIVCPAAEVGKQSPSITCTTDTHTSLSVTGVRFMKTSGLVGSCNANGCSPSLVYGQAVDVSKTSETRNSASWTLELRDVSMSDVTDWTCSVEFSNTGYWVASQPCRLSIYIKPTDIRCSHQFVRAAVMTTCTAGQAYPEVETCFWHVDDFKNGEFNVFGQMVYNDLVIGVNDYRPTCIASFNITDVGTYNVSVTMVSKLQNFEDETVKYTSVSVERPQQPPQLYHDGQLVENQTLSLTCQVTGGDPEVYRTIITCDNISPPFESDSNSVTMKVPVTRQLNGRRCTGSALHAASYTQTSSVVIRVAYPATVTSFGISSSKDGDSTIVVAGDEVAFPCEATGNPMPQIAVQRQNGPILTNSSTGDVTYQKTATCSDTGRYVCLASNMVKGQRHHDSRVVHLQVTCAPEHCNATSSPLFPAAVGARSVSINMCVRAYLAPASFSLYKGNTTSNMLTADKFQAYFNFTNEEEGLGEITVNISQFTQEDLGDYTLYSKFTTPGDLTIDYILTFSLFAEAPALPVSENGGSDVHVAGATVADVVPAVVLVIIIGVIIFLLKRKGVSCTRKRHQDAKTSVQEFNCRQADYDNQPGSRHDLEELPEAEAPEGAHYAKISDRRAVGADKPVKDANQVVLNAHDGDVKYENAASHL